MVKVVYRGPSQGIVTKEGGKAVAKGQEVEVEEDVLKALKRQGHLFDEPKGKKSDKADKEAEKE